MVNIQSVLDFVNLIIIPVFFTSVINTWAIIAYNYDSLKCIISIINMSNIGVLCYLKLEPHKLNTIFIVNNNNYIITAYIHLYGGMLMLGISTLNICMGVFCLCSFLYNLFYVIFNLEPRVSPVEFNQPIPNNRSLSDSNETIVPNTI